MTFFNNLSKQLTCNSEQENSKVLVLKKSRNIIAMGYSTFRKNVKQRIVSSEYVQILLSARMFWDSQDVGYLFLPTSRYQRLIPKAKKVNQLIKLTCPCY